MAVTHDIVGKLWNLCNVLKDDGVTYHQYVTELTYLLFLKMAEETEQEDKLPKGYPSIQSHNNSSPLYKISTQTTIILSPALINDHPRNPNSKQPIIQPSQ